MAIASRHFGSNLHPRVFTRVSQSTMATSGSGRSDLPVAAGAASSGGIGAPCTARRRRAQRARAEGRHVAWLTSLLSQTGHHTSSDVRLGEVMRLKKEIDELKTTVARLAAKVAGTNAKEAEGTKGENMDSNENEGLDSKLPFDDEVDMSYSSDGCAESSMDEDPGSEAEEEQSEDDSEDDSEEEDSEKEVPNKIRLHVKDQQGLTPYRVPVRMPLRRLMKTHCDRNGLEISQVLFVIREKELKLSPDVTARELIKYDGLEDGCHIEVVKKSDVTALASSVDLNFQNSECKARGKG